MKKVKILLVLQLCIGLLLGVSLIKQVEYCQRITQAEKISIIIECENGRMGVFNTNHKLNNVTKQIKNTKEQEVLAKSKREKILVTGDKSD